MALILALIMIAPTGCGNKNDNRAKIEVDDGANAITEDVSADDSANPAIKSDVSAGDIEANKSEEVIAKYYPAQAANETLYEFAKEADEKLFLEGEDKEGEPYWMEGTVLGTSDFYDYIDMLGLSKDMELPGDISFDNVKIITVDAMGEKVVFIDLYSFLTDYLKEAYKNDLITLKALKCQYDSLKAYTDFPAAGEKVKIFGQYVGYSDKNGSQVFVYGLSSLLHMNMWGIEYDKYHSDVTSHYKYKNYYEIDYPTAWGKPDEGGEVATVYTYNGNVTCDFFDSVEEGNLKANVDAYKQDWGLGNDFVTMLNEEYFDLPCGKQCYRAGFSYVSDSGQPIQLYVAVFEHKHKLMVLWYYDYLMNDYSDLYLEDFWKIVASVKPCGI